MPNLQRVTLSRPRAAEEDEFLRAHRATSPQVPNVLHLRVSGPDLEKPKRRYWIEM